MMTGCHLLRILVLKLWLDGQKGWWQENFSWNAWAFSKQLQEINWRERENKNMMHSLSKRKKTGECSGTKLCCRGSWTIFIFLQWQLENQHNQQPLAKKAWRKINTSTLLAAAIASTSNVATWKPMSIFQETHLQGLTKLSPIKPR